MINQPNGDLPLIYQLKIKSTLYILNCKGTAETKSGAVLFVISDINSKQDYESQLLM